MCVLEHYVDISVDLAANKAGGAYLLKRENLVIFGVFVMCFLRKVDWGWGTTLVVVGHGALAQVKYGWNYNTRREAGEGVLHHMRGIFCTFLLLYSSLCGSGGGWTTILQHLINSKFDTSTQCFPWCTGVSCFHISMYRSPWWCNGNLEPLQG